MNKVIKRLEEILSRGENHAYDSKWYRDQLLRYRLELIDEFDKESEAMQEMYVQVNLPDMNNEFARPKPLYQKYGLTYKQIGSLDEWKEKYGEQS